MRFLVLLPLAVAAVLAAGCAKKDSSTSSAAQAPAAGAPTASTSAPAGEYAAGQEEQISTDGSASDILARAAQKEAELDQVIANAQLDVVHKKAFAIRDLVVAAVEKAGASPADKAKLDEHVAKIKSLASDLDEAGDAGNLSKAKAEFADLRAELQAVRQLLGAHR